MSATTDQLEAFRREWQSSLTQGQGATPFVPNTSQRRAASPSDESAAVSATVGQHEGSAASAWCVVSPPSGQPSGDSSLPQAKRAKQDAPTAAGGEDPSGESNQPNYLSLLIADIDELETIPFFDVALPAEIGVKILSHLSIRDLCRCAQVSRAWSALAKDNSLWFRHATSQQLTSASDMEGSKNWMRFVKSCLRKRWELEQRWRELKAAFGELDATSRFDLGISAVHCRGDSVLIAKLDGTMTLQQWRPGKGRDATVCPGLVGDGAALTCLHQGENLMVSGSASGKVSIWSHGADVRRIATFTASNVDEAWPSTNAVRAVCASPMGAALAAANSQVVCFRSALDEPSSPQDHGGWVPAWSMDVPRQGELDLVPLGDSCCCLRTARSAEILDVAHGHALCTLHSDLLDTSGVCNGLATAPGRIILSTSEPTRHAVKLFDARNGALAQAVNLPRAASCFHYHNGSLAVGDRSSGINMYDAVSGQVAQRFITAGSRSLAAVSVRCDDMRVVSGVRQHQGRSMVHQCVVWDRRMPSQELWHIRSSLPVRQVHFTADKLVYSSCSTSIDPQLGFGGHRSPEKGQCFVLDFGAPLSELEGAACPFSSMYNDISGYNPALILATPYDNVAPDRLG